MNSGPDQYSAESMTLSSYSIALQPPWQFMCSKYKSLKPEMDNNLPKQSNTLNEIVLNRWTYDTLNTASTIKQDILHRTVFTYLRTLKKMPNIAVWDKFWKLVLFNNLLLLPQ